MIAKVRQIPKIIKEIDAVLNGLPNFHPKRPVLEGDRKNYMTGYRGELQVDYHLESIDNDNLLIFADIRLIHQNQAFQMDTLIVSPHFLLIIESKNIAGTLTFEKDSTQMIRELEGKKQGFKNPLIQVARQKEQLIGWLKKRKFPIIPVEDLVGIADRRTVIITTDDNRDIFKKLIHVDLLKEKIKQFEAIHTQNPLNKKQLQRLKNLLLKEHTPAPPSILKTHNIDETELFNGVQCPNCNSFPLIRQNQSWYCQKCKTYSKNAHKKTIYDYFLTRREMISNKQCRELLLLDSPDIPKKLLMRMNLPTTGTTKNRLYHRPRDL